VLLDTNFLIELQAEIGEALPGPARRFLANHRSAKFLISVISMGELAAGFPDSQSARDFFAAFKAARVATLKPEFALRAAAVDRHLIRTGQRLGENDNWLAGVALYHSMPIVSRDEAFDRVPGLRRIAY
jgi:predicted nucleic acid-binding protein